MAKNDFRVISVFKIIQVCLIKYVKNEISNLSLTKKRKSRKRKTKRGAKT